MLSPLGAELSASGWRGCPHPALARLGQGEQLLGRHLKVRYLELLQRQLLAQSAIKFGARERRML